jgi:hypothetical protein
MWTSVIGLSAVSAIFTRAFQTATSIAELEGTVETQ